MAKSFKTNVYSQQRQEAKCQTMTQLLFYFVSENFITQLLYWKKHIK